jgi:hypothetical protein
MATRHDVAYTEETAMTTNPQAATPADAQDGDEQRCAAGQAEVAEAAYFLAQQRDFAPGFELEDWLTAEALLQARSQSL